MANKSPDHPLFFQNDFMPILKKEDDLFPLDLFDDEALLGDESKSWWCIYTMSRREKELMRRLVKLEVPHYGPVIPKRYRSPNGRLRTSWIPLFPNYIFMFGDETSRHAALTTNCISKCNKVEEGEELLATLRKIKMIVDADVPLTPEGRLEPGNQVRVKSGHFAGFEGTVIRREGKTRFSLSIQYLNQGVSIEMDEALLESID
jgi:transcription antitermination factor NusG